MIRYSIKRYFYDQHDFSNPTLNVQYRLICDPFNNLTIRACMDVHQSLNFCFEICSINNFCIAFVPNSAGYIGSHCLSDMDSSYCKVKYNETSKYKY